MRFLEKLLSLMIVCLAVIIIVGIALQSNETARNKIAGNEIARNVSEAISQIGSQVKEAVNSLKGDIQSNPAIPLTGKVTAAPSADTAQSKVGKPVAAADLNSVWGETGMNGLTVYEYGKTLLNNDEKTCYCSIAEAVKNVSSKVKISTKLLPRQVKKAYEYYVYDHAEAFYLSGISLDYTQYDDNYEYIFTFGYRYNGDKNKITAMRAQLRLKALGLLNSAKGLSTDLQKEKALHDRLIKLCSYDTAAAHSPGAYQDSYSAYGALVNGKAVCQGYAQAMKLLLSSAGLKCLYITGQANGGSHSWNIVQICRKWFYLDATFDDPVYTDGSGKYISYNTVSYTYFNFTDKGDHVIGTYDSSDPISPSSENYAVMPKIG